MSVLVLGSLPQTIKACLVSFMVTVTEVETSNIHTSLDQLFQLGNFPASGSESTDDFGLTAGNISGRLDTVKSDVRSTQFGSRGACLGLHIG